LPSSAERTTPTSSADATASDLDPLEQQLLTALGDLAPTGSATPTPHADAVWRAQVESRCCDFAARWLAKYFRHRPLLNHAPALHHNDTIAHR